MQTNVSSALRRTALRTYSFTGAVLPQRAGQLITISQRVNGRDVTIVRTRTTSGGKYQVTRRFTRPGRIDYRATATGDTQNAAGSTTVRPLTIR